MSKFSTHALALAIALAATGCVSLAPKLPAQEAGIPAQWPLPPTTQSFVGAQPLTSDPAASQTAAASEGAAVADIGWRDFFEDPNLEQLIGRALDNNRDLRVAVLNVEKARAQYRIQRADRLPALNATAQLRRTGGDNQQVVDEYQAGASIANFELDLFGRVRSLSQSALQRYFAEEEARRAAQLSLIAEVANAYLTLAADRELLSVSEATLKNQQSAYDLTQKRRELGAVSGLELSQARTQVEQARADAARYAGQVAQDTNALNLLVGEQVDPALLPSKLTAGVTGLAALPQGLPSEVLLRRPDVLQAEHLLRAQNANIGAARAAFFPSISLTGFLGSASNELSGLFDSNTRSWLVNPVVNIPIFQGGKLRANLASAKADQKIALAQYEKAIQAGFRDVSDALALTKTLAEQRQAQEALVEAAARADQLSTARYKAGRDSYLNQLDAQRTLYGAQQGLVTTRLAEQSNRVALYKVLGGGWNERSQ
ncbi:efflux transporter outer membrane subunit [Lysobacter yananisis]|uniref:Efflux transporter outer membrane subunit n=1 Tax=Lysobacter yananisis TaxID=1003114 RepID=A0ABY9PDZ8_9GAMM|nr:MULTISPECIES: efflux transporter outer membrane subunit [Lysobacter]UZW61243.1 efflux transporter outer membrane subunit [Lysobacter enzymogenes]WMT05116.1 efflux transporter outer membrane subunit [Lysobacter yananisis]